MKKRLSSTILAFFLAMVLPVTAIAASHEAGSYADLVTAFGDTDADVYIVLTADITWDDGGILEAKEGQVYTIDGADYVLTNVAFQGAGKVDITADINGKNNDALSTAGSVEVSVTGDITSDIGDGINAEGESSVTVIGDIVAGEDAVDAQDSSSITVTGNVTSKTDEGIDANGQSSVVVTGDVTGGIHSNGVEATDEATVIVDGNVHGGDGQAPDADGNLYSWGEPSGDMNTSGSYSDGGLGVSASENSSVTVTGDVTGGDGYGSYGYGGSGIQAFNEATVQVGGSVAGGSVTANPDVAIENSEYSFGGYGIYMDSTASVSVNGDVTGGSTNGQDGSGGYGVYIILSLKEFDPAATAGTLTVNGTVTGGEATGPNGQDVSGVYYSAPPSNPVEDLVVPETTLQAIIGTGDASAIDGNMDPEIINTLAAQVQYPITVASAEHGMISVDKSTVKEGESFIITPKADEGYTLVKVLVNGVEIQAVNGAYSYTHSGQAGDTVSAEFAKIQMQSTAVLTGDQSQLPLYALMMATALCCCIAVIIYKKKQA